MTTRSLYSQGLGLIAAVTVLCVPSACAQQALDASTALAVREPPPPAPLLAASVLFSRA
jgi:hypothetical protein